MSSRISHQFLWGSSLQCTQILSCSFWNGSLPSGYLRLARRENNHITLNRIFCITENSFGSKWQKRLSLKGPRNNHYRWCFKPQNTDLGESFRSGWIQVALKNIGRIIQKYAYAYLHKHNKSQYKNIDILLCHHSFLLSFTLTAFSGFPLTVPSFHPTLLMGGSSSFLTSPYWSPALTL